MLPVPMLPMDNGEWRMLPMWKWCQFQCCQWTMGGLAGKPFHERRQNGLVSRLASHIQLVSRLASHVRTVGSAAWKAAFPVRLTGIAAILAAVLVTVILAAGAGRPPYRHAGGRWTARPLRSGTTSGNWQRVGRSRGMFL